jgi:hypothetical protein
MKDAIAATLEWLDTVLWVFTVIVAIGVVGEAVFGIWHVILSRRLRNLQHVEDQRHDQEMGELHDSAKGFEAKSETLRKENLSLQLEVLNLQKRLAWRRITQEQHDRFVPILNPYPRSVVRINGMGNGDLESETFAKDIDRLLRDAGWDVTLDFSNVSLPAPIGLDCRVDERGAAGKALTKVLNDLPTAAISPTQYTGAVALIRVGLKPPP